MRTKISPCFFDGIKYISIDDLPIDQNMMFSDWVTTSSYLLTPSQNKMGEKGLVKYEDYEYWFQNHYLAEKDWDQIL